MQAIVLVEMYSMFKSRTPFTGLSKNFEDIHGIVSFHSPTLVSSNLIFTFNQLSNDPEAILPIAGRVSPANLLPGEYPQSNPHMIESLCKQRMLLACYTLIHQHAALFGNSSTVDLPRSVLDLPFPTPQTRWDSPFPMDYPSEQIDTLSEALKATSNLTSPSTDYYDAFRSLLMISTISDPFDGLDPQDLPLLAIEPSPRVTLAFHTMTMCKNTPVRDLLAVVSESKRGTEIEHVAAQIELRDWARQPREEDVCVHVALSHAFATLDIYLKEAKTGLLYQEWAVFLAAIIIWARAQVVDQHQSDGVVSLEAGGGSKAVGALLQSGSSVVLSREDGHNVLLWAKSRLELAGGIAPNQGLVDRALNVLGKLISKDRKNWF